MTSFKVRSLKDPTNSNTFKDFSKEKKFLLHYVKKLSKLQYKFFYTFALQRFFDEIFQFDFFVLSANYVTLCIMSGC